MTSPSKPSAADVQLERDGFMRSMLHHLTGTLQDIVGLEEASGVVSIVGQVIGEEIDGAYRNALQLERLDRETLSEVLVDLKRRIQGDFYVIEQDDTKIVFGNRACPFGDKVIDRPALCMMTSNVFGSIAARNMGYAKVALDETIAKGAQGCRVTVYLKRDAASEATEGLEYYGDA